MLHFFTDPGCDRYSLSFTLRDSATDYVNVTCWGNDLFINDLAKSFKINDVGKLVLKKYKTEIRVLTKVGGAPP